MNKSYLSLKGLRCNEQQQTCLRHFECTFPATYKLTKGLNRLKNWMKRFYHVGINVDSHFKSSYSLCKKTVSKTIRLEIKLYLISSDNSLENHPLSIYPSNKGVFLQPLYKCVHPKLNTTHFMSSFVSKIFFSLNII